MKNNDSNKEIAVVNRLIAGEARIAERVEKLTDIPHRVRIFIDREVYDSPTPTTGEGLYELGHIAHHRELFREATGDHEDRVVPRNAVVIDLSGDDHFYSQKAVTILVNGEPHEETETRISFEAVVKIAYPVPPGGTCVEYTVTYRNGPPANPKGSLTAGHSVKIQNRMIFDVTPTDRS
ncbi:MAG TPA: multiubiquitin domain-containing protein [Acidobacteriaceae bacterium]|nr:multiubiquitin domain-containing protein [Acidobacteriaceae bacterium]